MSLYYISKKFCFCFCFFILFIHVLNSSVVNDVIFDTDMGYDDCLAISLMYSSMILPDNVYDNNFNVYLIGTVFGDESLDGGTRTALGMTQSVSPKNQFDQIPQITKGSNNSLPGGAHFPFETQDLLNIEYLLPKPITLTPTVNNASVVYNIIANKYSDKLFKLIAIGPLTNIAKTITVPGSNFVNIIDEVVIMGGAINVLGNVPPYFKAEYNFWGDPLAANITIASGMDIILFPLDICYQATCSVAYYNEYINSSLINEDYAKFMNSSIYSICIEYKEKIMYDVLTSAYLLDPSIVTEIQEMNVLVETQGNAAGQIYVDNDNGVPIRVATKLDKNKFTSLLQLALNQT